MKWKNASEPQSASIELLGKLLKRLKEDEKFLVPLFPPGTVQMLETMLTVATTVKGLELKKAPGKKKKQQGNKKGKAPAAIDPAALDAAVASAQTKFDTPEVFFEMEGGRAEYLRVLYEEVVASEDLGPAALFASLKKKNATPEEKQLRGALGKLVGQAFGAWKKGQK